MILSSQLRFILVLIAAALAGVMAPDVFHVLPLWAQVVVGSVSAALAGMGIIPPQLPATGPERAVDRAPSP